MVVKVASGIFVNQLNATNLISSKTQFQFQFELSLAQLSPSLSPRFSILGGESNNSCDICAGGTAAKYCEHSLFLSADFRSIKISLYSPVWVKCQD